MTGRAAAGRGPGPEQALSSAEPPGGFAAWAVGAVGLHVVLALLVYEPTLFPGGDNADYMILGEALRTGGGYRDVHLPAAPLHAKYPPGFPAWLAALGTVGGLQLFKLGSLLLTASAVAATAWLGRRLAGSAVGLAAGLVLAVNPVLLEYAHYVLSEAPFVALTVGALLAATGRSRGAWVGAVALAGAAFLVRTAGLALLAALPAAALLQGRRWRAAGTAGAGLAVTVSWAAWQRLAAPDRPGYLQELLLRDPYTPGAGSVEPAELVMRTASNLWAYVGDVLPSSVLGASPGAAGALLGVAVAGLALCGWARRAGGRPGTAELFAVLYAAMICLWPEVWTDRRFLLPLLPLLLVYAAAGTLWLGVRAGRFGGAGALGALGLLAVPGLLWVAERAPERMACLASYRAGTPCEAPAMADFYAVARWARTHTPAEAIVANRKPSLFYLHARRRGDLYPYSSDPAVVLRGLDAMAADYVVVDHISATTGRYLVPAIREHLDRFEPVHREGEPPTLLLRYRPPPRTAGLP